MLAIPQKCGIMKIQKEYRKQTEKKQEENRMKVTIKVNGKKISQKKAKELYGVERMRARIEEAKEEYMRDPMTLNTWMDGMEIIISR